MNDGIISRSNCILKKNSHASRRPASYFMKGIIIIMTVRNVVVSSEFVFKIRRRPVTDRLVYL